jgi:hypothetical protein
MQTNFLLGTLRMTPEARMALKRVPYDLVCRHAINDHGEISKRQLAINEMSMKTIGPIKSRYKADPTNPRTKYVVVQTDETWESTTIDLE